MRSNPHSLQKGRLLRLAALLLITPSALVRAQEAETEGGEVDPTLYNASYFTSTNYGGSRDGPFGISLPDWDSHFDSPNATHTVSLPIPDLTTRYSDRALNDSTATSYEDSGWNWTISLSDSIPVPREPNQSPGLTTGVQVRLNAPENITSPNTDGNSNPEGMDDSWQLCIIRWHLKEGEGTNSSTFARLRSRDDCNGALSRVCIRDLEAYAASGPDAFGRCRCPDPMAFESCKGEWFPSWSVCSQAPYRASEIRDWKDGSLPVFSYAGPPRDEDAGDDDNLLGYNATGHIVWPVMIVWGRRGDTSSSSLSSSVTTQSRTSLATATATRAGTITISSATSSLSSSSSSSLSSLVSLTASSASPVSTASPGNNNEKRQRNGNDGSSSNGGGGSGSSQAQAQAVAKLSCLAVREAEEGSVLPGTPLREANAASNGKFAGVLDHMHVLIGVWGLVAGYMAFL